MYNLILSGEMPTRRLRIIFISRFRKKNVFLLLVMYNFALSGEMPPRTVADPGLQLRRGPTCKGLTMNVEFCEDNSRLLPKVLVKKALNAKRSARFCQKSAKIMLIFLKSARGLHKNAHFFPIFFKHIILNFSDFQLHFSLFSWKLLNPIMYAYGFCLTVSPSLILSTD